MPIWSDEYGLIGKADVVEFHEAEPVPVEYKVGRITGEHAALQLCAQALCLEEMLDVPVRSGALYSHATKRRIPVDINKELRDRTRTAIVAVRALLMEQQLPHAVNDNRCPNCSLVNACLPGVVAEVARVRGHQGALFKPASEQVVAGWPDV
jgi:CRISPR-associated exonuclease Cas4